MFLKKVFILVLSFIISFQKMGKNVYSKCKLVAAQLKAAGYEEVDTEDLDRLIFKFFGSDPRTVRNVRRTFLAFEILIPKGLLSYKINGISGTERQAQTKIEMFV